MFRPDDERCRGLWAAVILLLLLCLSPAASGQEPDLPPDTRFVMSFFKANTVGGDERLHIAVSPDGQNWTALNGGNAVWQHPQWPHYVVRDPTIVFHKGWYWVAHTSGAYGRHPEHPAFGLLKSKDLLNWTHVGEIDTTIPGMTDPFTWNPCFFKDSDGSLHVFVSISPINGHNFYPIPALRTYELHPLNDDMTEWSAPALVELPHSNTNEFWAWKDGDTYHAVYVSFSSNGQLVHATSKNLLTGWGNERVFGFPTEEGIFVLKKPDGNYRLYSETGNGTATGYLWRDTNRDFSVFTQPTLTTTDTPMRNGKPTAAAPFLTYDTWRARFMPDVPAGDSAPAADADQDGLSNLQEYAFDLNPLRPSSSPILLTDANGLATTWRRSSSRKDVAVTPQLASQLGTWEGDPAALAIESVTLMIDGSEQVQARRIGAAPAAGRQFIRLEVALPTDGAAILSAEPPTPIKVRRQKARKRR